MDLGEADLFGILEEHKKQKDLTVNKIRFFWEEILQCISAVHDKNIIHADVKPENFIRYTKNYLTYNLDKLDFFKSSWAVENNRFWSGKTFKQL